MSTINDGRTDADNAELSRDAILNHAFHTLSGRIGSSSWTESETPHADLVAALRALASQPDVAADVASVLQAQPAVRPAVEMLFTTIAMSARASWQDVTPEARGIAARGWFLGRWLPTFLVVDGPITRFLSSKAFGRQRPVVPLLKDVRRFFAERLLWTARRAFAHWSFEWTTDGEDSQITVFDDSGAQVECITRAEADALHIVAYAAVEALYEVFMRNGTPAVSATPTSSETTTAEPAVPYAFDPIWKYVDEVGRQVNRCDAQWATIVAVAERQRGLFARVRDGDNGAVSELRVVQGAIVDATEAFLFQSAQVSLLLFSPSGRRRVVDRCRRVRRLLQIDDDELEPLRTRSLRDAFAHMDERIDTAIERHGDRFALNYFEAERNESVPLDRCLRTFDTSNLRVFILGVPHDLRAIHDALLCVRSGLELAEMTRKQADAALVAPG